MSKLNENLKKVNTELKNISEETRESLKNDPTLYDVDVCRTDKVQRARGIRIFYDLKFLLRIFLLICSVVLFTFSIFSYQSWCTGNFLKVCSWCESQFDVLHGWNMFRKFSVLDILFLCWCIDIIVQVVPIGKRIALGSNKVYNKFFRKEEHDVPKKLLKDYMKNQSKGAYLIFLIWIIFLGVLAFLKFNPWFLTSDYQLHLLDKINFLICVAFYVCDLICVLVWCPFRVFFMKNRCCTTCRIFNWDHFMMLTPMGFTVGFYPMFLAGCAVFTFLIWEFNVLVNPEKFWEGTNKALRCENCTDLLCGKARGKNNRFSKLHTFLYRELQNLRNKWKKENRTENKNDEKHE